MWTKTFGGASNDAGNAVIETAEGDFLVCGHTFSFSADGDMDLWLIKTDISGYTLWTNMYGGNGAGDKDIWLLHLEADGQVGLDENVYPTSSNCELKQNFPNPPFVGSTTIEYFIPGSGIVSLEIYELTGRLIST